MRENGTLSWLLSDHLGSTYLVTTSSGALSAEFRYKAFGETRFAAGISPTTYGYTGQRAEDLVVLQLYRVLWYDPPQCVCVQRSRKVRQTQRRGGQVGVGFLSKGGKEGRPLDIRDQVILPGSSWDILWAGPWAPPS